MHASFIYDVAIAGAGPVGLFLACELRLSGISVLLLEQAEHPESPLKRFPFGIRGLSSPTIEAFQRRGLLDDITAPRRETAFSGAAPVAHWMQQARAAGGHFAGIPFYRDKIDTSKWPWRLPDAGQASVACELQQIEAVLERRAAALGVVIRRGCGVTGFSQSDDEVFIDAGNEQWRARWLVGCDAGRSTVRKSGGFVFSGTEPEFTGYSADIDIADPHQLTPGRHYTDGGMYTWQRPGTLAMVDFDGGAFHRTQPLTPAHVQSVLQRVSGVAVSVTALRLATTWTDRAFQATSYRRGRVLLAGDAAHIHSPLGGQGLNLGLGDAMNLGWKLAATIRGEAPDGLLDTYERERHPVGAQVLDWSRAQVGLMRPSRSSRALEAILRELIETPDGATYFAQRVWGLSLRYDLGDPHPLVGRSAPDFVLDDGTRLGEHMRHGQAVLLDFGEGKLQAMARKWPGRVAHVTGDTRDRLGVDALLVRPDGIVAWAGDGVGDAAGLVRAVSTWLCPS